MDTLLNTYRSDEDDKEIQIPYPNPNPNPVHSHPTHTRIVSDPVHNRMINAEMESKHDEKIRIESDPNRSLVTSTQMKSDHGEKTQMGSDPVCGQIMDSQMDSDHGEKTQMGSDPVHDQILNTRVESDPIVKTRLESILVQSHKTNTQMVSDPVEKIQAESDPVHNVIAHTQIGSDPGENTQMESDPNNNGVTDTQMEIDPTTKPMDSESAEPHLTVVEQGKNVGGETLSKVESLGSEEVSTDSISEDGGNPESSDKKSVDNGEDESSDQNPPKKQKSLSQMEMEATTPVTNTSVVSSGGSKKKSSKKKSKNNNVWTKPTSRKGKKKAKNFNQSTPKTPQDMVYVAPIPRFPDRNDDSPDAKICLSKFYKAEKVEISEDRLSASSCKGYRMVRATRGVTEGAWYFEIKVVHLGETGHTRLGWSNEKGDLQAPVGYDGSSFGYRDIDGSKIHKALREKYGDEGYKEGDVIGFYINLPNGNLYAPKPAHMVWYKGQKFAYAPDTKSDPQIVPGSEISFFKNGLCQGVAYKDLSGGCYYPAASMYTLPSQPNCTVKFNFGPDFECFPTDFEGRPFPNPMIEVPYHGFENREENVVVDEMKV